MEKMGIENFKKILTSAMEVVKVGDEIGHEGSAAGMTRWFKVTSLFDDLMVLSTVDFKALKAEVADFDAAEKAEIFELLKVKFDIIDDKLELALEEAVGLVIDAASIVERALKLKDAFKA